MSASASEPREPVGSDPAGSGSAPRGRRAGPVLVLGLGNPGDEYEGTRHNIGFEIVRALAGKLGWRWEPDRRALVARGERAGQPVALAQPTTYMNLSGRAAGDLVQELGARTEVLVVCDDFHLPLGRLRCRRKGSAGGQKGLASIIERLPDRDVARLRCGIGEPGRVPAETFVLQHFKKAEAREVESLVDRAANHLADWLEHRDLDRLINAANAPPA